LGILQGQGPYSKSIKQTEEDIQSIIKRVNELSGIKESDTGLAPPALWDLAADKQVLQNEQPLQVHMGVGRIYETGMEVRL
jgi:26S proteasome regulatory subunit T1